jgi:NIMA (never in mitosis gene a)-related kinase
MNIMHRDLKPANIFLWRGNQSRAVNNSILIEDEGKNLDSNSIIAKIGDMNVSKLARVDGLNYTQTGTPYYASPEVWRDQPYDFKSDVWSLGCILYEMTALRAPFQARDMDELFKKVTKGVYPKVPSVYSLELTNMIKAMLTVEASLRPSIYQILSMPSVQTRLEKLFPEDASGLMVNSSLLNQSIVSKKNSGRGQ